MWYVDVMLTHLRSVCACTCVGGSPASNSIHWESRKMLRGTVLSYSLCTVQYFRTYRVYLQLLESDRHIVPTQYQVHAYISPIPSPIIPSHPISKQHTHIQSILCPLFTHALELRKPHARKQSKANPIPIHIHISGSVPFPSRPRETFHIFIPAPLHSFAGERQRQRLEDQRQCGSMWLIRQIKVQYSTYEGMY